MRYLRAPVISLYLQIPCLHAAIIDSSRPLPPPSPPMCIPAPLSSCRYKGHRPHHASWSAPQHPVAASCGKAHPPDARFTAFFFVNHLHAVLTCIICARAFCCSTPPLPVPPSKQTTNQRNKQINHNKLNQQTNRHTTITTETYTRAVFCLQIAGFGD